MSVASKNSFALLNDAEPEVESRSSDQATPVVEAPKPNRKPQSTRGGRYYQRGGPKPAVTSPVVEADAPVSPSGEKKFNRGERGDRPFRGERGERGDRGRGRGGRGRGRGDRDPRPDRHSTTGVTDSQKKVHQGWGGDRGDTELKDETNGAIDASAGDNWGAPATDAWDAPADKAAEDDPWAEPAPAEGAEGETKDDAGKPAGDDEGRRRKRFEDEEDEGKMTLEEWRAKNAPAETVPKLEPRKIAEGSSEFFKDAKQLLKTEDNDYFAGKQPKTTSAPRPRKESKQFIEIDAHFEPPSRGGRGRGGRGGRGGYGDSPRGDRPERGGRGGRGGYGGGGGGGGGRNQQQRAVNVEDTTAFPSL